MACLPGVSTHKISKNTTKSPVSNMLQELPVYVLPLRETGTESCLSHVTSDTTVRRHLDDTTQFIQRHVVFYCCFLFVFFTLEPVAIVGVPWVEFFPLVWTQNSYCIRKWQQSLQDSIKVPKYITYICGINYSIVIMMVLLTFLITSLQIQSNHRWNHSNNIYIISGRSNPRPLFHVSKVTTVSVSH